MSKALTLFGLFPLPSSGLWFAAGYAADAERRLLSEYGVVLDDAARRVAPLVEEAISRVRPAFADLNRAFFTWRQAASVTDVERVVHQALHYLSTYGAEQAEIPHEHARVYLPLEDVDAAATERTLPLMLVRGISKAALADVCLAALHAPAGMAAATIEDILDCLFHEAGYRPRGDERFANREAQVRFAIRTGTAAGEDMLRWFVMQATGESLLVVNETTIRRIEASGFALPALDVPTMQRLAESFLRFKLLWLAFKRANRANAPVINRLRRLAKRMHRPFQRPLLLRVTEPAALDLDELRRAAERAPLAQVVRAYYALITAADIADDAPAVVRVRTGKLFVASDRPARRPVDPARRVVLREVLARRLRRVAPIAMPPGITPALPQSERQLIAGLPAFSAIAAPDGHALLVGVHWTNTDSDGWEGRVDLDLSALSSDGEKVGWNAAWSRNAPGDRLGSDDIAYSGDVTDAPLPHGAVEWLWFGPAAPPALVVLNQFAGNPERATLIVASVPLDQPAPDRNWVAPANAVLWQGEILLPTHGRELAIGIAEGGRLILTGGTTGGGAVARPGALRQGLLRFIQQRAAAIAADAATTALLPVTPQPGARPGLEQWLALLA